MVTGAINNFKTKYAQKAKQATVILVFTAGVVYYIFYFYFNLFRGIIKFSHISYIQFLKYLYRFYMYGSKININLIPRFPKFNLKKSQTKIKLKNPNIMKQNLSKINGKSSKTYHNLIDHHKKSRSIIKTTLIFVFFPLYLSYKILRWLTSIEFKIKPFSFASITLAIVFTAIFAFASFYISILDELPDVNSLQYFDPKQTTHIYDRKGNLLYRTYDDEDRYFVKIADVPKQIIDATIASEDADFYNHYGLSLKGIVRAAKKTYTEDDVQGGSTITQQLVKNTLLTSERTYIRKVKEAILALEIERRFTKDQILEMYLNKISYGGTSYGIKSAARKYFGKDLNELTLAEISFLAGLPASPSTYSPLTNDISKGKARQKDVLDLMVKGGYVTQEQSEDAFKQDLSFVAKGEVIKAPHFVNYVMSELEKRYGQKMISKGGLEVYTSIDMDVQSNLQTIVSSRVKEMQKRFGVGNGAAMITNPSTGEIYAMVGSVNYWDELNDGQVNVATSLRQPGSSIKPLTYALAFENGYNPFDTIEDAPVTFPIPNEKPYKPENYDGSYHGRVTLKAALANSYNIPAVKLLDKLGVNTFLDFADQSGITTFADRNRFGLAVTLGGGEVRMVDMATAYSMFPNNGYKIDVDPIIKIYDRYGNIVYNNGCAKLSLEEQSLLTHRIISAKYNAGDIEGFDTCERTKVISESTAYYISDILSDNKARLPAFGFSNNLGIKDRQIAVKTGTTQNEKDNWTIGYSNNFMVLSWIGNNDGAPMRNIASGYASASLIWRDAFDFLISKRHVPEKLATPDNMIEVLVCPYTNTLACNGCQNIKRTYVKGTEPKVRCSSESIGKVMEEIENRKKDQEKQD